MSLDRCLACGTDFNGAPQCPKCARPKPLLLLDLETRVTASGPRPQIVQRDRRSPVLILGVVGLLVAVIAAVAVARLGGGGGGTSAPETSAPTTLANATTEPAPSTAVAVASTVPTSRPATTAPPPTTAYVNGRMGAVFGEKVAFRLYAFDAGALRGYVDTATGQLVDAAASVPGDQVFAGSDTRVFVLNSRTQTLSTIDRNLRESPVTIARDVQWTFPSTNGRLWAVDTPQTANSGSHLVEFAADGTKGAELTIQAPFAVRGSLGGAIVTSAAGQIFLHDPKTGRVSPYAVGDLMAVNGSRAAWLGCDAAPSCHLYIGDVTHPRLATVSSSTVPLDADFVLSLSPTGDAAVVPPGSREGFRLLNFATGLDLLLTFGDDNLTWSPDGRWLFNTNSATPQAIDVTGGRAVDISLSGPDHAPFRVVPL